MAEAAGPSAGSSDINTMADEEHFVDKHKFELIKRVSKVAPILDELLRENVIQQESYDKIRTLPTSQEKMSELLSGPLRSSGVQGKDIFYKILNRNEPDLIEDLKRTKVETMMIKRMLFETLKDLTTEEFEEFKSLIELEKSFPPISRKVTSTQDLVELMVETHSQECVELTQNILKKMNRTDLVQRLSDISSGTKEKHSVDEQQPSLIQKVETMVSVIELLLETLKDLSDKELNKFKEVLRQIHVFTYDSDITLMLLNSTDIQDTVFSVVQTFGQQSVEKTKEVLKKMKRTDLVERLSGSSSGPKKKQSVEERQSALIHKVATLAAVKELLLETLKDLSYKERKSFKWFLQFMIFQRSLPDITLGRLQWTNSVDELVDGMMKSCGQQSVEVTREVFMDMNRTDLVQKLSETSSGLKEKHSVDEHWPAFIQKVETMVSVIELLLETLKDLSDTELKGFKMVVLEQIHVLRYDSCITWTLLCSIDIQDTVFLMVQTFGQQSVEKTKEVLKEMKRTVLVGRLSDGSSGPKQKHSADEVHSALIQRVATITAVKHLLLETLNDLSDEELKKFRLLLQFIVHQKYLPDISRMLRHTAEREEIANQMLQTYGQQSVELTREVYVNMNRTNLIQRLSKPSSGLKDKHSEDEHRPFHRAAVKYILLETLSDLSHKELLKFKCLQQFTYFQKSLPQISWSRQEWGQRAAKLVDLLVQTCGQQSVEVTKEVFMDMNRIDLVQRLSETSSRVKEKHQSKTIHKGATMTSLQVNLLETLKDLSYGELEDFKHVLQYTRMKDDLPRIPRHLMETTDRVEIVELMVEYYGQQSVEVTREVLKKMNRSDLVLSSFKPTTDTLGPALFDRDVAMTSLQEDLLETLKDFSYGELEDFKHVLQYAKMKEGLPRIPRHLMETADRVQTVKLMVKNYGQQSVEVTREVLKKMNRRDLVQRLSDISSGSKGPSRSFKLEACGSMMQDSSDWTKLEPEVSRTDADEAPTYSLQSEAGNFECSVSRLRWVCKEKVSFKYQFRSGQEPMERIESMKYMPAGPLMDIKITAGKFDEVYLPHWICIDDNLAIKDKFAVLHIEECGNFMGKVSEVTPSHVKLSEPHFSLKMVLVKAGFPLKINCKVLIYKTNTAFLTLHVYLIPHDPGLQQAMDKRELSYGYKVIRKPYPEKSLKMCDRFVLKADLRSAKISPQNLKLRYDNRDPNFFEVYIKNPDGDFTLNLAQRNETQPVWTHEIRKDEYQSTAHTQEEHSVDEHLSALMQAASITTDRERLFEILGHLKQEEFEEFKWFLQDSDFLAGLPCIPCSRLEKANMLCLVDLMLNTYSQQSVEVTKRVFKKINRNDLVQRL